MLDLLCQHVCIITNNVIIHTFKLENTDEQL
jgi:hypothetical protein